jgi:predicted transposase/invertase (TIGR01784 family)
MGSKFGETSFIYLLGTDDKNDPNELMQAIRQAAPQYNDTIMTAARQLEIRGEKIGKKIGEQARNLAIAQNMLKKGYSVQSIQEITDLSKEAIEKLKEGGLLNHR